MTDSIGSQHRRNVSRRRFVQAVGVTGAAGLAGCLGDDIDEVRLAANSDYADIGDEIVAALYDAGLDEEIDVDITPGDDDTDSRRAEITSILDAGRSHPDIFMMDSGWTVPFIIRDQLINLSDELADETIDYAESEYLDSALDTARDPETGELYALPLFVDYPVMMYRQDLVEDAGYDPESESWATEPMSWQAFAEIVEDVWDHHGGPDGDYDYGFTTQAAAYEGLACCTFNETMTSFGGAYFGDHENLFGPVGDRPITVDEEPVHDTIRMMRSFMYGPGDEDTLDGYPQIASSDLVEFQEEPSREPFTADNAIFHRNWPYAVVINGEEFGDDLGVMPIPYGVEEGEAEYAGTGGSSHALGGGHLAINPNTERIGEVRSVLEAFASEPVMNTIMQELGQLPPDPSVTEGVDRDEIGVVGNYLDTFTAVGENTVPRPATDVWPEQSALVYQEVHDAYTGRKTSEEAMGELEELLADTEA